MARVMVCAVAVLLALSFAGPVSAEEFGTFIRTSAYTDLSGRTEVVIHKAYAGRSGPIRDVIGVQDSDPNGYPKVEIVTSGAIQATRTSGGITVESTGPGRGDLDIFIIFDRLQSSWWLQAAEAPGVGAVRLNAVTQFGPGVHAARAGNHVTVYSKEGQEQKLVDQSSRKLWSVNATIPAGTIILFNIAAEVDRVAPLWLTQVSLGVALAALALSGHLFMKLRSKR